MAVDPISIGLSTLSFISGASKSSSSEKAQQEAQRISWEEKIRAYEYNIGLAKREMTGMIGDIQREGAAFQRYQAAAIGASGAEIGAGTPLMMMIETAATIERDIARTRTAYEEQIKYYEQEIAEYKKLLKPWESAEKVREAKRKRTWGTVGIIDKKMG